jgi:hypothetical protein
MRQAILAQNSTSCPDLLVIVLGGLLDVLMN